MDYTICFYFSIDSFIIIDLIHLLTHISHNQHIPSGTYKDYSFRLLNIDYCTNHCIFIILLFDEIILQIISTKDKGY